MWSHVVGFIESVADDPGDDLELRLQKRVLVGVSALVAVLAVVWGALYLAVDEPVAASIPLLYSTAVTASMIVYYVTRRYRWFRFVQLFLILVLPFLLQLALGGFVGASAVIIWALLAPLGALAMSGRRQALAWFGAYVVLVLAAQWIQPSLAIDNNLSDSFVAAFFVMNTLAPSAVAFIAMHYFVGQKDEAFSMLHLEQEKSERLLLNVLPMQIAQQLKEEEQTIATSFPAVSVLFADVVGFTPISRAMSAEGLVDLLNDVFSYFDSLADRYGLEKIRTIGDAYMVASGVPVPRDDHAHALASMALDMVRYQPPARVGIQPLVFRLGMSSGPAVAGVIGKAKFQYDVWGDTVNTASRMESHGVPGRIQISQATHHLIRDHFVCEHRGVVDVKGAGELDTWFLVGPRGPVAEDALG